MPGFYCITFQPSGKSTNFARTRGEIYLYPDGTELDVHANPVWCLECGKVTHGEHVETLDELDRHIAEFEDPTSESSRFCPLTGRVQLQELKRRRVWLTKRRSPAKCLECSSTRIVQLSFDPMPHPGGDGTIECVCTGMCSTTFTNRPYTPEGDRMPGPVRPSYWHWPGEPDPALERARAEAEAEWQRLQSDVKNDRKDAEAVDPAVIDAIHKELGMP
jgi:hypothetical protein